MTKEQVLFRSFKRTFIYYQLFRTALEDIRTSDTIKEWSKEAKVCKNKDFIDLRPHVADSIRKLDSLMLILKKTMQPKTFNAIMDVLQSEQVKEIDLLVEELTNLSAETIEKVTETIKEEKLLNNIQIANKT